MEPENRRQWERFLHPTQVELTAAGYVLPARLVDVSRQGMQVVVPVLLHVGDEVSAALPSTLPTPLAAGAVRGRVCWTEPARSAGAPQTRAGVIFEAPLIEAAPLPASRNEQAGSSVIVQFSGAMPQVMARALQSDAGLRLRFTLPSLREGSILTLHSQDDVAKEMRVIGARLEKEDGGAQVELLVEPCPETRKRRFLQYGEPAPPTQAVAVPAASAKPDELRVPKRSVLAGVGIGASLVAAFWLTARAHRPLSEVVAERDSPLATQSVTHAATELLARAPALVMPPDKRATPARHTIAPAAASGVQPQPSAAEASSEPAEPPQPAEAKPSVAAPEPAPPQATPDAPSTPPSASAAPRAAALSTTKLSVSTTKEMSEIFVPVTGSLAGLATKIWTDPPAVVVEIPKGQIALKQKHYDIQKEGVKGINIGAPGGVTQVRVYVNSILSQYDATPVPGGISIRIKRDLQSLP